MSHQCLIASYWKDFGWLDSCLRSLHKFSRGFLPPAISVDSADAAAAREIAARCYPGSEVWVMDGPPGMGNLRAQVSMMCGDILCTKADYVWLVGSDCVVSGEFTPESFFKDGRPVMLVNSYDHLQKHSAAVIPWREGVFRALGKRPDYEYMRRLPLIYPISVFTGVRRHMLSLHGKSFERYVYESGAYASNRSDAGNFSESNVMGAFAHTYLPDLYEWVNLDTDYDAKIAQFPSPMIQFWSHGGPNRPCDFSHPLGRTPQEIISQILP